MWVSPVSAVTFIVTCACLPGSKFSFPSIDTDDLESSGNAPAAAVYCYCQSAPVAAHQFVLHKIPSENYYTSFENSGFNSPGVIWRDERKQLSDISSVVSSEVSSVLSVDSPLSVLPASVEPCSCVVAAWVVESPPLLPLPAAVTVIVAPAFETEQLSSPQVYTSELPVPT